MRKLVLVVSSLFVVATCGGGGTAINSPTPTPTVSPTPAPLFIMVAQNASGVAGEGQVFIGPSSFTVTIKLTGMIPNSSHISHVHTGLCTRTGGIAFALQQVIADSSGAATATTTVPAAYAPWAVGGWYVNVHHGPDLTTPANAPSISCGDLPQG